MGLGIHMYAYVHKYAYEFLTAAWVFFIDRFNWLHLACSKCVGNYSRNFSHLSASLWLGRRNFLFSQALSTTCTQTYIQTNTHTHTYTYIIYIYRCVLLFFRLCYFKICMPMLLKCNQSVTPVQSQVSQ